MIQITKIFLNLRSSINFTVPLESSSQAAAVRVWVLYNLNTETVNLLRSKLGKVVC